MAFTENELNSILQRAGNLMSNEGQKKIEQMTALNRNNYNSDGVYNVNSSKHYRTNESATKQPILTNKKSNLPTAIIESIMKNPIDDSGFNELPNFKIEQQNLLVSEQNIPQQSIHQQEIQQPQPYVPVMQTIDYNYIRSIVNECVQANLNQIKDELLKESSLKAIRINGENKIQLIDTKNNLYESKLEFKKNISKKQ